MTIDHEYTDLPVCPHCGETVADWAEGPGGNAEDGEQWLTVCDKCGKEYIATIYIDTSFVTNKIQNAMQAMNIAGKAKK